MFSDFLDKISDLFSGSGDCNHCGHNDIASGIGHSGLDLSMYSTDEIKEAMKVAVDSDGVDGHSSSHDHNISFGAASDVDARNLAKSTLITKLNANHINTYKLYTDNLWGGLDSYSGHQVYDAINSARDNNMISESVYKELMALLKKACHYQ